VARRLNTTAVAHPAKRPPPIHFHHWPTTNPQPFISDQPGKKCTYTETVATIVVVVVCGGADRGAGNNGYGEGRNRAATARGPHPRRIKTPLRRHATRREAARRLARWLPAASSAATAAVDRLARGPGLRPLQPRATRHRLPADRVPGIFSAARVPWPLRRRCRMTTLLLIHADSILHSGGSTLHQLHPPPFTRA